MKLSLGSTQRVEIHTSAHLSTSEGEKTKSRISGQPGKYFPKYLDSKLSKSLFWAILNQSNLDWLLSDWLLIPLQTKLSKYCSFQRTSYSSSSPFARIPGCSFISSGMRCLVKVCTSRTARHRSWVSGERTECHFLSIPTLYNRNSKYYKYC